MKTFIRIVLLIIILSFMAIVFATAQSDAKINRLAKETGLYIRTILADTSAGFRTETEIFCGEDLVTHFINKRHFIAHTSKFILDLEVKKRKVGKYNSWVAVDEQGGYYFITPFIVDGAGYGVFIQPVNKDLGRRYDLPIITIANFNLCQ